MKLFGSFVGAAIVAGAGLAYYVHQRHQRMGVGYLDVIKQLPGEVQRAGDEALRRAAEAVEQGKAAARRKEADLARQLEAASASSSGPAGGVDMPPAAAATPSAETPPAAEPEPTTA
jgi:hypothetical protein